MKLASRPLRITVLASVTYVLTYWLPGSPLPTRLPWGVIVQGVIFGSSNALLAIGLILVYRTTRIVNFAYGAMGALPGALALGLYLNHGWSYWAALALGVLSGALIGGVVEVVVVRRFADSSRLTLTVASIGLAQVLGGLALAVMTWLGVNGLVGNVETPIDWSFDVRPYAVRGDHLLLLATVPVVLAGLAWFLLRTDAGMAVRAAAENQDRALLLGVPIRPLRTMVWALAGGLAAVTYLTRAPFTGMVPEGVLGVTAILPGLAVATVARFRSMPVALAAGIGLGVVEWTVRWNIDKASIFDVTYLVVILVALLLQRSSSTRGGTEESSWDAAGQLRPVPEDVRRLPVIRGTRVALVVIGLGLVVIVSANAAPSTVVLMSFAVVWSIVAVSLVVLPGWGGNVSLGQFGIVGVGAMAAGNLIARWNVDFMLAALAATAAGAIVAVLIGIPALRVRGLNLAVATLAFAVALDSYFLNPVNFPSLVPDTVPRPVLLKRFDTASPWVCFGCCLIVLLVAVTLVRGLRQAHAGRAMIGTRDNDRAAAALAVPTTQVKLMTFTVAGALAGLAGALFVLVLAGAGQGTFQPGMSLEIFAMAVIGGLELPIAAIAGVVLLKALDFVLTANLSGDAAMIAQMGITGTGLLVVLAVLPGGLWQFVQRQRDRLLDVLTSHRDGPEGPAGSGGASVTDDASAEAFAGALAEGPR